MFGSVGLPELGVILGIVMLIFGPRQLPRIGRAIGQTIKELKGVKKELIGDVEDDWR